MNWRLKGIGQKLLTNLPSGMAFNDLLQHTVGGLRNFEANVATKVNDDWIILADHMRNLGIPLAGKCYMEIGTGWYPTLPVCWHLAGAARVITFDLRRHLNQKLTARMLHALESHLPIIADAGGRPLADVISEYQTLSPSQLPLDYRAPADATVSGLVNESVDVVFSNSVLEHIDRSVIARLMIESHRILRCGGIAIHSVACNDHYRHFDRRITPINYLQYTEKQWKFWNNDFQYQNRLRPQDFLELAEHAGLKIILSKHQPQPNLLKILSTLNIAPEFQRYSPEQLCCTSLDFVAQKI